ncbi:hypothetical protein KCP75_13385 [Salmonella enterica subsp. enterica]|nr:hypothetical protein KCP75_13385 [Salmonella enterica subsp. enterica]
MKSLCLTTSWIPVLTPYRYSYRADGKIGDGKDLLSLMSPALFVSRTGEESGLGYLMTRPIRCRLLAGWAANHRFNRPAVAPM